MSTYEELLRESRDWWMRRAKEHLDYGFSQSIGMLFTGIAFGWSCATRDAHAARIGCAVTIAFVAITMGIGRTISRHYRREDEQSQ